MSNITLPLTDLYAPIRAGLDRAVEIMDRELASDLPFVANLCRRVQSFRGKMLRPAVLLLTGEALGGASAEHHTLAAVVELVHLATLVHDDVLDEADLRRNQTTVNALSGNETAVMLGDYLISHAFHLCSSLESQHASRLIGRTTNTVCEGELMQLNQRGNLDLTEAEYFEIIRRKTAALTGAACALGACFASADARVIADMGKFGEHAGIAFQIMDDILDITGCEERVGKTLGRDLDLGKMTLPLIHFLAQTEPARRPRALQGLHEALVERRGGIGATLRDAGSLDYALEIAQQNVSQSLVALEILPFSAARSALASMAEFIVRRDR